MRCQRDVNHAKSVGKNHACLYKYVLGVQEKESECKMQTYEGRKKMRENTIKCFSFIVDMKEINIIHIYRYIYIYTLFGMELKLVIYFVPHINEALPVFKFIYFFPTHLKVPGR